MAQLWHRARRLEITGLEQQLRDTQTRLAGVLRLQQCAGLDDLTGLPAYRVFQTALRREWDRARRDHVALSLFELSVENLTAYNKGTRPRGGGRGVEIGGVETARGGSTGR